MVFNCINSYLKFLKSAILVNTNNKIRSIKIWILGIFSQILHLILSQKVTDTFIPTNLQVKFHKTKTETLASGSLDGLLNIYNILEQTEDDALTYSLNVENSVEKLSWLDDVRLACVTQSNDLQVWDADSGDMLKSYGRDKIAKSIKVCCIVKTINLLCSSQ